MLKYPDYGDRATKIQIDPSSVGAPSSPQPRRNALPASHQALLLAKTNKWGWLPELALLEALSLLVVAYAFAGARAEAAWGEPLFWVGLALLLVPAAVRLASVEASRQERIGIVVLVGMAMYLVKVMHSPVAFTFPDELSHLRNLRELLQSHHLFQENPVLPATAYYPGLATVTGTIVWLSHLPVFEAGLVVIGAARLVLLLALYLLHEQVSGSSRVGGLATILYMANYNFLYWLAEYAYESVALPLLVLVMFVVARREMRTEKGQRAPWTAAALLALLAVVATHHITSYVLTGLLWAITIFFFIGTRGKRRGALGLAVVSSLAIGFWATFVATPTADYLVPVLYGAFNSIITMTSGEGTRQLFESSKSGYVAPVWESILAIGSVLLIALAVPFGLQRIWQRHRDNMFALLLAGIALVYFPMQLLRLTSRGWETSNRSSEFVFIGLSLVLALAVTELDRLPKADKVRRLVFPGFMVILFFGGLIAGWPPPARLPRPYYVVDGNGHAIEPQGVVVARWTRDSLGPDNRMATDKSNAKLIGAYGEQFPYTGGAHGIQAMLLADSVGRTERNILRKTGVDYVMVDRRRISWNGMIGLYFFNQDRSPAWELDLNERGVNEKFEHEHEVSRVLDSGDIVIYDVGVYGETAVE